MFRDALVYNHGRRRAARLSKRQRSMLSHDQDESSLDHTLHYSRRDAITFNSSEKLNYFNVEVTCRIYIYFF